MKLSNKAAALAAFSLAIRPLVRLMLGSGIVWKQAADTLKESFVEVAESEYGLHGRVANASRVAILTGLNRRDVKRVRDTMAGDSQPALARMNSATRLLGAWHTDPAFQAADGKPAPLSTEDDETGFGALCRRYAADIPVTAMLKELTRVGAVSESPDGFVKPLKRYYMPDPLDADAVIRAGNVLGDLASTVEFNLQINSTREQRTRFEGRAWNADIPANLEPEFREYLEQEGQAMLERVDQWLADRQTLNKTTARRKKKRLGVGIYQIEEDS